MGKPLSPAEALVLWKGIDNAVEAMKITLTALMAEGVLRAETRRGPFGLGSATFVRATGKAPPAEPLYLQDILAIVREVEARNGALKALILALRRRYRNGFHDFTRKDVAPLLVQRGLATYDAVVVLGMPLWRRFRRTRAGDIEARRIDSQLAQLRELPALAKHDRMWAAGLALAAGGLIFLLPELRPFYGEIGALLRPAGGDAGGGTSGGETVEHSAFDGLDASLGSFGDSLDSAGGSDAGGDSGGDGGGGDGGGGGD